MRRNNEVGQVERRRRRRGGRVLLRSSHRSGTVRLAAPASPPLSPPLPPDHAPLLPLAPPSVPLAGAKVIDSENVVIAFDCQLKWQL